VDQPNHKPCRLDRKTLAAAVRTLTRRDPALRRLVRRDGPPPLWARPVGFATLMRIILEQQVSLASARATFSRLQAAVGVVLPRAVVALGFEGLRSVGFTRQKARYGFDCAQNILAGAFSLSALARAGDDAARDELMRVRGVGRWTADIYLVMALRRPDIWPTGDLALQHALMRARRLSSLPSTAEAARHAMDWAPWRAVAARILWHAYLSERRLARRSGGRYADSSVGESKRLRLGTAA
jgi:DNA-3-methyladenine glycosylase II